MNSNLTEDLRRKVRSIIEEKKKSDPRGFSKAMNDNVLIQYLAKDLQKASINPSFLSVDKNGQVSIQIPSTTSRSVSKIDEVDQISNALDEHLFEPYYQATLATNHMNLAEVISACKSAGRIHSRLVNIKVSCAVVSVLSLSFSVYNLMAGRIPMAALNLLLSADTLRVSYNCYLKNYCSIFIRQHFGNATKMGETLFQMAKTAVGLAEPGEDPMLKLKYDVVWSILAEDTITKKLYLKAEEIFKK